MESTHDVRIGAAKVTKRFVSHDRGEAEREWRALRLLERFAPGVAPTPITLSREESGPTVEMSRLPGDPLGAVPLTGQQTRAVLAAMTSVHQAIPPDVLADLPERILGAAEMVDLLRQETAMPVAAPPGVVADALALGTAWIRSESADRIRRPRSRVFARADGNLANILWDGDRCRVVDFEDSGSGDLAYEVADLLEHVSAWLTGVLDTGEVLAALTLDDEDRRRVRDARRALAVFWLLRLLPGGSGHDRNPPGSVDRQAERLLGLLA